MFIPLNDTERNRYGPLPVMTIFIILVNTFILFFVPYENWPALATFGTIPYETIHRLDTGILNNVSTMFLHGGLFHWGGNMLALWVFGRRVEDACGPWRYLLFYLFAGTLANILFIVSAPASHIPLIGASGAIFGVMGAYLLLYPEGRIRTFMLISLIPAWPRIRAVWIVLYMLAIQILPAMDSVMNGTNYSTAHWAHLGGFVASIAIYLFLRPDAFARYLSDVQV